MAKIALDVPKTESSIKVYNDMKWLPLHLRRQLHTASYMYRIINDICPSNSMSRFQYVSGGSRNGSSCNLYINKSKTLKDFYYLGAKCWNNVPNSAREANDINSFSKNYKSQLLNSAVNDPDYRVNNNFDYMYKIMSSPENACDNETHQSVLHSVRLLFT